MAPRTRGGSSSRNRKGKAVAQEEEQTYDQRLFLNEKAQIKYVKGLQTKRFIAERGIEFEKFSFRDQFLHRGWVKLADTPRIAVQQIVREFYANGFQNFASRGYVRGQGIDCSSVSINEYYGTPSLREDEYTWLRESADPQEIASIIAQPDAQWKTTRGPKSRYLHHKELKSEAKALLKFICARLIPAMHITEVIWDRAVLIYCILTNKSIDIGKIIITSIVVTMAGSTTGSYGFPSLITGLAEENGVQWVMNEVLFLKPMSKISPESVRTAREGNVGNFPKPVRQRNVSSSKGQLPNNMEELCDWVQQIDIKIEDMHQEMRRMMQFQLQIGRHLGIEFQESAVHDEAMVETNENEDDDNEGDDYNDDDEGDDDNNDEEDDYVSPDF